VSATPKLDAALKSAPAKLVERIANARTSPLKVNERVRLGDFQPLVDREAICLLAQTMDRCGLVLEVEKAPAHLTLTLYAARRTRRATTVKI
jgi:hypothetical protein